MGNVTGVLLWRKPLSEERAVFQEWKNASESLRVSQAILHFVFSYLSGIKDGDRKFDSCFLASGFFQTSVVERGGGKPFWFISISSVLKQDRLLVAGDRVARFSHTRRPNSRTSAALQQQCCCRAPWFFSSQINSRRRVFVHVFCRLRHRDRARASHVWAVASFVYKIACLEKPRMLHPSICMWITSTQIKPPKFP